MIAARFVEGGEGQAVAFDGAVVTLITGTPQAPGRPVEVVLEFADGAITLRGKSRGSKRREDGRFDVWLRPVALRREERARLEAAFARG